MTEPDTEYQNKDYKKIIKKLDKILEGNIVLNKKDNMITKILKIE